MRRTTFGEMPVLLGMLPLLCGLGRGKGPLLLLVMGVTGDAALPRSTRCLWGVCGARLFPFGTDLSSEPGR